MCFVFYSPFFVPFFLSSIITLSFSLVHFFEGIPSDVCEFDEYGNYVIKLEAKHETERYPNDKYDGRWFREILWNERKKLSMSEAQQRVGSQREFGSQHGREPLSCLDLQQDKDNLFISHSSRKQTVRGDYVHTKILNRRNQELLYSSNRKAIENYRNYINNVILQNMAMTQIPFCKADTSKAIENDSKIYSVVEIIRDVFHADFREAIKNSIEDHPEQVAEAAGVPMVKDCHLAYVSEPRVQSSYYRKRE